MGKKAGRLKQVAALLAAVSCIFGSVPYASFAYAKDGAEVLEIMEEETEHTETEEKNKAETVEEEMETETEGSEAMDTEQETETAGTEEQGEQPGENDTETGGTETGETENGEAKNGTETEEPESTEGTEEDTEAAAGEVDMVSEPEDTEIEETELLEEGMLSVHADEEDDAEADSSYTDSNGVTYSYYGYEDGTAEIYAITDYEGKNVNIPDEINGYTVTKLTGGLTMSTNLASLTIPEHVTYIGAHLFWGINIGTLYYNAAEASTVDNSLLSPFASTRVGEFYTGGNVRVIKKWIFSLTEFTGSVELAVAEVETNAFANAKFQELTLTDRIGTLHAAAFQQAKIKALHYNTHAAHTAGSITEATFYQSSIDALDIGEDITEMPGYVFSGAYFNFNEFTLDLERVGDYAFHSAWPSYDPYYVNLTVTKNVKYLGAGAFSQCDIRMLHMDADMETGAKDSLTGVFYAAKIGGLSIGGNVTQIPDYLFSNAYVTQGTLDLSVERIGKFAFYDRTTITDLTIGEDVKDIGRYAFGSSEITRLHYNAVNATVGGDEELAAGQAPFESVAFSKISFGEKVGSIPRCLFAFARFSMESLGLPDSVTSIGNLAFYSSRSGDITIGNLTIGENIGYIGKAAFSNCSIGSLSYRPERAEVYAAEKMGDCPFIYTKIGSLEITENVKEIPAYLMEGMELVQDELVIPDSVTRIGTSAFRDKMLGNDIEIGTLVIGENVSYIGAKAFADSTIHKVVVHALKADEEYKALSFSNTELPICESAEIHTGSDFYLYFTKRTSKANITSMCREFETVYGEERFDAGKGVYVTPYTESCVVCGYGTQGEETKAAHKVKFVDHDGKVLSQQNVKDGGSAEAPESPARMGYRFTGWDRGFENITEDITVTAQYEVQKFTVTFKDGDTVLEEQEVEYGKNAQEPEKPEREAEEWGTWEFAGWEGSYEAVTEDVTIQAKFIQKWNQYQVIFYDALGMELSVQTVEYGKAARAPEAPQKMSDAQYDYTFSGWSADYAGIKADVKIYPQYSSRIRSYTVTFLDAEDNILDTQTIQYGSPAISPKAPQKESTEQYEYIFTGWDHDITEISKDTVARPTYEAKTRTYKVIFADGDTVIDEQDVEYGSDAIEPEAPTRPKEEWGVWKFVEWIGNFLGITKDETVQAVFEKVLNRYAVTFYDGEGNVIKTQFVEHGSSAEPPEAPEKEPTAESVYDFTGWNGDLTNITGTSSFYPVYESRVRSYAVVFLDAEGETLSSQTVEYGKSAEIPEAPEKKADAWNTYAFTGWGGDTKHITEDVVFRPQYEAKTRSYTVTFIDGDTVIDRQTVKAGNRAELPEDPEREEEEWGTWGFAGWKGNYENVLKDETVEAVFEKELNVYTVIFEDEDGNIISEQEVTHGQGAVIPKAPEKEPEKESVYIFTGWDGDTGNITKDSVFSPVYKKQVRYYTVIFISEGKTIDTQSVKYGDAASVPKDPVKEADEEFEYIFIGWDGDHSFITEDVTFHAVFETMEIQPDDNDTEQDGNDEEPDDEEPDDNDEEPDNNDEKPDDKDKEPGDGDKKPGDKDKEPGDSDKKPGDKDKEPGGGDKKPGDKDKEPGGNDRKPKEPENNDNKQKDNIEDPGSDNKPGNGQKLEIEITFGTDTDRETPQISDKEQDLDKDMTETENGQTESTEQEKETENTEEPEPDDSGEDRSGIDALLFSILSGSVLLLLLLLLFFYYRRKKVCGTVLKTDGKPAENLSITLERADTSEAKDALSGKYIWTASTDEDGYFEFSGLPKGNYWLTFPFMPGHSVFSVTIYMGEKGENIFMIPASCSDVKGEKKGRKYIVNVGTKLIKK